MSILRRGPHWRRLAALAPILLLVGGACSDTPFATQPAVRSPVAARAVTTASSDLDQFRLLVMQLTKQHVLSTEQANALFAEFEADVLRRRADGNPPDGEYFGALIVQLQTLVATGVLTPSQALPLLDLVQQLNGTWISRRTLAAGYRFTCALTDAGHAQCWGINAFGQLGDGTTYTQLSPVAVQGGIAFRQITAGSDHACGLTETGRVYCWGGNASGQLGDRTTIDRHAPVVVLTARRFTSIAAGGYHTCALTSEGHAYCWGRGDFDQTGFGTQSIPSEPTAIADRRPYAEMWGGAFHSCGIAVVGGAECWGWNAYGQLGTGTLRSERVPTAVVGGSNFVHVFPHYVHGCALDQGGAAYCWGENASGNVGDGTTIRRLAPSAVAGGWTFTTLSNAPDLGTFSCGVSTTGVNLCWGINNYGQVGDGTTTTRLVPTPIAFSVPFTEVTGGGEHNCGRTAVGEIYCWGGNFTGQVGDGTTITRLRPTLVRLAN